MKKYSIYIGILALGILLGWLLFGRNSTEKTTEHHHEASEEASQMWTCSMHPQIQQSEPGDCPICGMDLIPATTSEGMMTADQFQLSENAMALANIQTTTVGAEPMESGKFRLSGTIVENEAATSHQIAYVSGRVERLYINTTGETVRKGQLLAQIYSPELYAAQQELLTAASLKTSQPALYKAVRNKLKLWKLSDAQIRAIEASGEVQETLPVYATVSGTVIDKMVEEGDQIIQGSALLKVVNLNTVWAELDVYESQLEHFKIGQSMTLKTNAYPNDVFKAEVDFMDPLLNSQTRTATMRVVLKNDKNRLKPGMFVTGLVENETSEAEVITVPASAVMWTGKRSVVYLKVKPDSPTFEMREVGLGAKLGDQYEIEDGLVHGDVIVTHGTFTVDAAAQLQGKKSMMNTSGGAMQTGHEGHRMQETQKHLTKEMPPLENVSSVFQEQLNKVYLVYEDIKNALVNDQKIENDAAVETLLSALKQVDMSLLPDEAHTVWMELQARLEASVKAMMKAEDLAQQRTHFKPLSKTMVLAVQQFGIIETVYQQFCPMADGNKGATWLSSEKTIKNPYFGAAMLRCGSVEKTF